MSITIEGDSTMPLSRTSGDILILKTLKYVKLWMNEPRHVYEFVKINLFYNFYERR